MDDTLISKLEQCDTLPSVPAAAARILHLAEKPNTSMADLADAVSLDPALSVRLLRMANSPMYALRRQSDNLREAIVLLGLQTTMTLTLSFSLLSTLRASKPNGLDYNLFWRRSLLTASVARVIARKYSGAPVEECFLAALLQDIGMLILDAVDENNYDGFDPMNQPDHLMLIDYELDNLDCDHAEAGAWLLKQWGLPEHLVQAVALSHSDEIGDDGYMEGALSKTVNIAALCADAFVPLAPEQNAWDAQNCAMKFWDVDEHWLHDVLVTLAPEIPEIESVFEVALFDEGELDRMLESSRSLLAERSLHNIKELQTERAQSDRIRREVSDMRERGKRDGLTALYNRTYVSEILEDEFTLSREHDWPLSVIFIDLDHFKSVNDRYGHEAGDAVLIKASEILAEAVRENDIVARWGGEEFLVVLPGSGEEAASLLAQRLVETFRSDGHIVRDGEPIAMTISAGTATMGKHKPFRGTADLVQAADQAMYQAKSLGRNNMVAYG